MRGTRKSSGGVLPAIVVIFVIVVFRTFFSGDDTNHKKSPPAKSGVSAPSQQAEREPGLGVRTSEGFVTWPPAADGNVQMAGNAMAANYLIMLDVSGSMADIACGEHETKMDAAKRAIKGFYRKLGPDTNVGLYTFSSNVREVMPLGRYGGETFDTSVDSLNAGGATALTNALSMSEKVLRRQAQAQGGYGNYNLVLVTDGQSTDGEPDSIARKIARDTAVSINVVGFCTGQQHSLNLPGITRFSDAKTADQLAESLSRAVQAEQDIFDIDDFQSN